MARIPRAQPLTNIGTTRPIARPLTEPARPVLPTGLPIGGTFQRFRPGATPEALIEAQREGEPPGPQAIAPDPLWISRWQPTATVPPEDGPWVVGYRWWVQNVIYQSIGTPLPYYRIDLMWRDHRHAYVGIGRDLWQEFRQLQTSVGQWFHRRILGPGWHRGQGAMYDGFPH